MYVCISCVLHIAICKRILLCIGLLSLQHFSKVDCWVLLQVPGTVRTACTVFTACTICTYVQHRPLGRSLRNYRRCYILSIPQPLYFTRYSVYSMYSMYSTYSMYSIVLYQVQYVQFRNIPGTVCTVSVGPLARKQAFRNLAYCRFCFFYSKKKIGSGARHP